MANISVAEAQAWIETTKLTLGSLDTELEASISSQVLGTVAQVYDTSSWADTATTPDLIRKAIAMMYTGWIYSRTYAEDADPGVVTYGELLRQYAKTLLDGIVAGSIDLLDATPSVDIGAPYFYPTDTSSASEPNEDDTSLGPEKFTMGVIW